MDNIYLIGFMGSGKTTIGSRLASLMHRSFIDTDRFIEDELGISVARLIEEIGEDEFRRVEAQTLVKVSGKSCSIIATGGGIVKTPGNIELMKSTGLVIYLSASPAQILERVGNGEGRPLLSASDIKNRIAELLAEREELYNQADYRVSTDGKDIDGILDEIVLLAGGCVTMGIPQEHTVSVSARAGNYPVSVKPGILAEIGSRIKKCGLSGKVFVVTNPTVYDYYGIRLERAFQRAGIDWTVFQIPDGEEFKTLNIVYGVWEKALDEGLDRKSLIVSLGGGVVCDLAGFAAAAYMRGISVIHIPTTLLAQVDASVGGKVAVNLPKGKNAVGAFWQPRSVYIDPVTLATLDSREVRSGMAEIIKHGVALDRSLFEWLSVNQDKVADGSPDMWADLIAWNVRLKARVVSEDETEQGIRAVLNFGHTVGHAIESLTNYSIYRHGEAVAIGMACASEISRKLGLIGDTDHERLIELLSLYDLQTAIPGLEACEILSAIKKDKKSESGEIKWVVLNGLGSAGTLKIADERVVAESLRRFGAL